MKGEAFLDFGLALSFRVYIDGIRFSEAPLQLRRLGVALMVHVPTYHILGPSSSSYIGTLGPSYRLFGYTLNPYRILLDPLKEPFKQPYLISPMIL